MNSNQYRKNDRIVVDGNVSGKVVSHRGRRVGFLHSETGEFHVVDEKRVLPSGNNPTTTKE